MTSETKISIDAFKTVTKAIAYSPNLDLMANQLAQLLVGALEIKACAILVFDLETRNLGKKKRASPLLSPSPLWSQKMFWVLCGCTTMRFGRSRNRIWTPFSFWLFSSGWP